MLTGSCTAHLTICQMAGPPLWLQSIHPTPTSSLLLLSLQPQANSDFLCLLISWLFQCFDFFSVSFLASQYIIKVYYILEVTSLNSLF